MDDRKVKTRRVHLFAYPEVTHRRKQLFMFFYFILGVRRRHFLLPSSTTSVPGDHSCVGYVIFVQKVVVMSFIIKASSYVKLLSYYFSRLFRIVNFDCYSTLCVRAFLWYYMFICVYVSLYVVCCVVFLVCVNWRVRVCAYSLVRRNLLDILYRSFQVFVHLNKPFL